MTILAIRLMAVLLVFAASTPASAMSVQEAPKDARGHSLYADPDQRFDVMADQYVDSDGLIHLLPPSSADRDEDTMLARRGFDLRSDHWSNRADGPNTRFDRAVHGSAADPMRLSVPSEWR